MISRDLFQLQWFSGYTLMSTTLHLTSLPISWLMGSEQTEYIPSLFTTLLVSQRKDLNWGSDHYTLCLKWVETRTTQCFRREYMITFYKSILFTHQFKCCLQTYEYHYKMNHVSVLYFKTFFPKEADGTDWQQLLKIFNSICMCNDEAF